MSIGATSSAGETMENNNNNKLASLEDVQDQNFDPVTKRLTVEDASTKKYKIL